MVRQQHPPSSTAALSLMLAGGVIYFDRYRAKVSYLDMETTMPLQKWPKPPIFLKFFLDNDLKLGIMLMKCLCFLNFFVILFAIEFFEPSCILPIM
ncbi:hypothetical protein Pfo_021876 [Paulownia fortunei]|nr:hypothetical protein Pfo_021876 [Paulownia fortunei]